MRWRLFTAGLALLPPLWACVPELVKPQARAEAGAGQEGSRRADLATDRAPLDQRAAEPTLVIDKQQVSPDLFGGSWYQVDGQDCAYYCGKLGRTNAGSVEGTFCMSGEVRPGSGIAAGIKFLYGCPGHDCQAQSGQGAAHSVDVHWCYRPDQWQDDEDTDVTVGCFCW